MFTKAKTMMEDHLKAFGVDPFPPIVEVEGKGISFLTNSAGTGIGIGKNSIVEEVPLVEWMVATGTALLQQAGSDVAAVVFGHEVDTNDDAAHVADDLQYILDLAAIYQCYLQNPVEAYCIYDDAIELHDEASLHPIAAALGLSHPRGLEALGFDKKEHKAVFEETDFFKSVITHKRPDLSLLIALQNAWQKQRGVNVKIRNDAGLLRFSNV